MRDKSGNIGEGTDPSSEAQIEELLQRLTTAEATLQTLLEGQVDAVLDSVSGAPLLLRQTQEALRESEARYRRLVSRMAAMVLELDIDGTLLFINEAVTAITGYQPQALAGNTWRKLLFSPQQRHQIDDLFRVLDSHDVTDHELELTAQDGSRIILALNTANRYSPTGELERIIGFATDITARKRAEAEIQSLNAELEQRFAARTAELESLNEKLKAESAERRRTQERLEAVIQSAPEGIVVTDADARILLTNAAAEQLYQRRVPYEREFQSHAQLEICYPDGRPYEPRDLPLTRAALDHEKQENVELLIRWPDGQQRNLLVNCAPIRDARGRVTGAVGVFQDITERKRIEAALRQAREELEQRGQRRTVELAQTVEALKAEMQERERVEMALRASRSTLESLFEATPDAILLSDEQGYLVRVNRQTEVIFGYTREELYGQPVELLIPQALQQQHIRHRSIYYADPSLRPMGAGRELRGRRRDGSQFPVEVMLGPVQVGESTYVIGVVHDISQQVEMRRELQQSEARFQAVFENAPFGLSLTDLQGQLMTINPALQEMLGYSEEHLRGRSFAEITHPADVEFNRRVFEALVQGEEDRYPITKRYIRQDGKIIWAKLNASLVRDSEGQPQFSAAIVEDITAQKQMETELAEVRRRLNEGQELERIFLAQELHDGPVQDLYAINFQLNALDRMLPEELRLAQLDRAQEIVKRTTRSLRQICHELRPPALAPFGLHAAIRSHAEDFQQRHPGLEMELDLVPDAQELPESTRLALFRIYQQALSNVSRHAHAQGVRICFQMGAEWVILEIEDDGRGFEVPRQWFELARAGHLGLVGAAERAEMLGGRLEIQSTPGKGTLMRVIVPRAPRQPGGE